MNDKSIIGFGYKPNFAKAVCLKTNSTTRLGDVEYKIIHRRPLRTGICRT